MFELLKKKKPLQKPNIVYIFLRFNVAGIRQWLETKGEIPAGKRWDRDEVVTRTIFYFPESDLHYHKDCNQFSHVLGGVDYLPEEMGQIEWSLRGGYFVVALEYPKREWIFWCPLDDIGRLIATGDVSAVDPQHPSVYDARHPKEEVIELPTGPHDSPEHCKNLERRWDNGRLSFANELFSLDISLPRPSHTTWYGEK